MNTTKPTDPIDIMWRRYRAEKRLDDMPDTRITKIENAFRAGARAMHEHHWDVAAPETEEGSAHDT